MSDKLDSILAKVKKFMLEEVIPIEEGSFIGTWKDKQGIIKNKREKVKAMGLWTPQIPIKWGGLGLSLAEFGQVSEILGMSPYGHYLFNCQAPDAGNMEILIEHGTPDQQERYLKPLLAGKIRSCFSMTEPDYAGSNPVMMGTTGVKDGDDYVINGRKWFTTGADGAAFAIVMCVTNPEAENRYQRASQIIVPTDTAGFGFIRNISIMGDEGSGWTSHSELEYTNCRTHKSNLLGAEGAGFAIAQNRLGPGRIHHCMRWMGICERAFDLMCKRALSREISPGKSLATKQTIQNWIAESRAEINGARMMVMDAAHKIDTIGAYKARIEVSIIKFHCAKVMQNVLDRAIQVHGALGITDDTPLATWFSHERAARIYDGADEVHKSRVAKLILRAY